jgi:ankyrin repeat protein
LTLCPGINPGTKQESGYKNIERDSHRCYVGSPTLNTNHIIKLRNGRSQNKMVPRKYGKVILTPPTPSEILEDEEQADADDENLWSPLQTAARDGDYEAARQLIESLSSTTLSASLSDAVNESPHGWYGQTALQAASANGHLSIVNLLLDAGANVDAPGGNNGGRTALTLAALNGHQEIVQRLLDAGANINIAPHKYAGRTPLQGAAEYGHIKIVKLLLEKGAQINAPVAHYSARTALTAAAGGGHWKVVDLLVGAGAEVNPRLMRYKTFTPLQAAAYGGYLHVVERLIKAGANVNAEGCHYNGYTALAAAAEQGHADVVERLLAAGADVLQRSGNKNWTAYQSAYFVGQEEIATRLWKLENAHALTQPPS